MIKNKVFYGYKIETESENLPLTLTEVYTHLRLPESSEDTYITSLIKSVQYFFENYTNRTLINTSYKAFLDDFPSSYYYLSYEDGILIKKSKISSITSIKYYIDGVLTTWSSSNYYLTDEPSFPKVLLTENSSFPTTDDRKQAIEIIFVAGYGTANTAIPQDIKLALLNHVSFLYENRGDCGGDGTCQLPCTVKIIYEKYRIHSLGWEDNY